MVRAFHRWLQQAADGGNLRGKKGNANPDRAMAAQQRNPTRRLVRHQLERVCRKHVPGTEQALRRHVSRCPGRPDQERLVVVVARAWSPDAYAQTWVKCPLAVSQTRTKNYGD